MIVEILVHLNELKGAQATTKTIRLVAPAIHIAAMKNRRRTKASVIIIIVIIFSFCCLFIYFREEKNLRLFSSSMNPINSLSS